MRLIGTASRVERNTSSDSNGAIENATTMRLAYYRNHTDEIPERLREIDKEWDIERALETGSSALSLLGLVLAVARNKKWIILPIVVQSFFLQHAIQGWCPPLPVLRKLGFRTVAEIEYERSVLKALKASQKSSI